MSVINNRRSSGKRLDFLNIKTKEMVNLNNKITNIYPLWNLFKRHKNEIILVYKIYEQEHKYEMFEWHF